MVLMGQSAAEVSRSTSGGINDSNDLQAAFELFSQVSTQLSDSYRALENQVVELSAERDRADRQRLRELEEKERISERLQSLLDLLPGGVVVLDSHGFVCDSNPAADEILGASLVGQRWLEVIARCFAPRHDDGHEVSLRDGRRLSLATRSLAGGCGQVILLTDQTETRLLQEQLARQERLTLMGRMLAALAHQIRTPLAAAMLYTGHLAREQLDNSQVRRFADKTLARLHAMEQQVRDMLIFVKGDVQITGQLPLQELLDAIEGEMEAVLTRSGYHCQWTVESDIDCKVQCNRDALVGAVMNLVNNAIQAAPEQQGFELCVAGDDVGQLRITVRDFGDGMDEETMRRVQDAFYSTKSHGTGLGLAVVRAVARAHHGELELQSSPGEGTLATISLPLLPAMTEIENVG